MIRSQSYCFIGIITIYFFFCLLPLPNTLSSPTRSLCRRDQRDALLELQKELPVHRRHQSYIKSMEGTTWNKSVDCCSWKGVRCDTNSGEVIFLQLDVDATGKTSLKPTSGLFKLQHLRHLDLSSCNLQGDIPSSIGNLSHLTSLALCCNQLVGEVPASIGNLNQLESIDLSSNNLRGNIPASIGNLNQLREIYLFDNNLSGIIPTSFSNLTKLTELYLHENQFTGGHISNITSLSIINLSSNHFKSSIIADLSRLHNLEKFFGYKNSFSGPFPTSLLMLSSLVSIGLGGNQFVGSIEFGNTSSSSKLVQLILSDNNFGGRVPSSISRLVNLEHLDLSHNNFGGLIPRSLSKLVNLSELDLSYNRLEGQVPYCLWTSPGMYSVKLSHNSFSSLGKSVEIVDGVSLGLLDLGSNSLQGPFPQWICIRYLLFFLDMSNNHFTGSIPQCLKNFISLEKLNLRNNSLSGFLPDLCIHGFVLRSLDVSRNNLVGKLPKSLINCTKLEFLNVRGNKIKDTFPFWLASLPFLHVLVLRSNAFYGPVYNHSAYFGFPGMRIIDISNNNFVGSLPQDYFANWPAMSWLWNNSQVIFKGIHLGDDLIQQTYLFHSDYMEDSIDLMYKGVDTDFVRIYGGFKAINFSGNQFSGYIPESIGRLSDLRLLNLSGNTFIGNVPPSLANITKLETLDLSRNNLSGEIPQGLGKLSFMSTIDLSYNHLEGLVPRSTQFGTQNCSSFMGNPGLYGLEEICGKRHFPVPTVQQPEESLSESEEPVLNWIAAAIAFGPGVFCGLVIGHIFTSYKHEWFIAR